MAERNARKRTIIRVEADIRYPEQIDIELDNGSYITLTLKPKENDPLFAEIRELALPRTDGQRVYWANGASLTLEEIMAMLRDGHVPAEKADEKIIQKGLDK
jgi:hypothetical protein